MTTAQTFKEEGNEFFKKGEFLKAAGSYTKAIKEDPNNAVLYSNRAVALLKLKKLQKALEDAEKCTELDPTWDKGFFRKGSVLEELEKSEEAYECYKKAIELNPQNAEAGERVKNLGRFLKKSEQRAHNVKHTEGAKPAAGTSRITDEESYKAAMEGRGEGEAIPYSEDRLESWVEDMKKVALAGYVESGDKEHHPATVWFLPGRKDKGGEEQMGQVSIKGAFDSPDMHANAVEFLRKYAGDTEAHASFLLVMKSDVAYPQVWQSQRWPKHIGNTRGFFLQMQSKGGLKRLWFVPTPKGSKLPHEPVLLQVDEFPLLPTLFRS